MRGSPGCCATRATGHRADRADAIEDYDKIVGVLRKVRGSGIRLAIDDVGAGFSSLQHILRLNPDVIKLDVSLTRSVDADPARRALAAGFVSFARELGSSLVAEGVETQQECYALLGLGVPLMQGYLLGRPGPAPARPRDGALSADE